MVRSGDFQTVAKRIRDATSPTGEISAILPTTEIFAATASCNQIAGSNPHLHEVKKVYQNVKIEAVDLDSGRIRIHNGFFFTNLEQFEMRWELRKDGDKRLLEARSARSILDLGNRASWRSRCQRDWLSETGEWVLVVSAGP